MGRTISKYRGRISQSAVARDRYRSVRVYVAVLFDADEAFRQRSQLAFPAVPPRRGNTAARRRHLAVVICKETAGGGKILDNSIFMSLMLRVG
jgi:hypothetical protein